MSDKSPKVIPPFAAQPANSGGRVNDSDWMCPDVVCGNINFARRNTCNRCGKERVDLKSKKKLGTEIGKSAADKSRGLFSADDWQCNKCANVNWARRQTCNVCNAPKFGEVEARTGYGGGYNERGTVEYRPKRDSDDDEYDEFGRRKKRKLKDSSSSQAEKRPKPSVDSESGPLAEGKARKAEEEDEDEESGEEGDLSKYDLWGSEAEQEEPQEKGQSKSPKAANNNPTAEKTNDNQKEKSKSPPSKNNDDKRKSSESGSASSRSSSSSSSSSDSSSGKTPQNRYDDFNLNSEHSPPSPPGRVKDRGGRSDRNRDRGRGNQTASRHHHHRPTAHKVDSGRRHRTHRHRR